MVKYAITIIIVFAALLYWALSAKSSPDKSVSVTVGKTTATAIEEAETVDQKSTSDSTEQASPDESEEVVIEAKHESDIQSEEAVAAEMKEELASKRKLLGGADVVWIEPEPKDENNKFGTPPE